jgi:acyl-CoA thioester hydrolase
MSESLIYSYEQVVTEADIDELNHVNNVVYVQWIQDAAIRHWGSIAPEHIQKSFVWVIVRHEIDYRRSGLLNDILLIQTRVLSAGGASSVRQVQIFRKNDMQLLVESKTTWCIIDAVTHRPARISDEIKIMFLGSIHKY